MTTRALEGADLAQAVAELGTLALTAEAAASALRKGHTDEAAAWIARLARAAARLDALCREVA